LPKAVDLHQSHACAGLYDDLPIRVCNSLYAIASRGKIMEMTALPLSNIEAKPGEPIPQSKEGRALMDSYFDLMGKAIASIPTGGTQLGEKLKGYLEANIATARDYMRKLGRAKDFNEVVRTQIGFAQTQFNAFTRQASDLSETYAKTATDALHRPFK
jgi:hypothetical protein